MAQATVDPERSTRMRVGGSIVLILSLSLVLAALAFEYGDTGGSSHNAVLGIFTAIMAIPMLRSPFKSAGVAWLAALAGLITAAAPFLYEYQNYTLTMGATIWMGIVITICSVFVASEALNLNVRKTELEPDTAPTARAEPQD